MQIQESFHTKLPRTGNIKPGNLKEDYMVNLLDLITYIITLSGLFLLPLKYIQIYDFTNTFTGFQHISFYTYQNY